MLTYKVKLIFDNKDVQMYWTNLICQVRDAYNYTSEIVFNEKLKLDVKVFHNSLYRKIRTKYPELPAQMCIKVYKHVLANYKSTKSNKHNIKKPLILKKPCIQLDKCLYSKLTSTSINVSSGKKNHRTTIQFQTYKKFNELSSTCLMCDPSFQYDENIQTFYCCVPFLNKYDTRQNSDCVGLDLGVRRLITTSDGNAYTDKDYLKNRRKIRHKKSIFKSHKKYSHSSRRKLKQLKHKKFNVSNNMIHHLVNRILKDHTQSTIVMEDLTKIKYNTSRFKDTNYKRTKHNNRISQVPFYRLKQVLEYKALQLGTTVETVSPFMTSQTDCRTGQTNGKRIGCRFYCSDNIVLDADWNAAINIVNRKHPTSFNIPKDGTLNFVSRLMLLSQ